MRAFMIWLFGATTMVAVAGAAFHTHFSKAPRHVVVVLDTSLDMASLWPGVEEALDRIDDPPYAVYSLYTPRSRLHGPEPQLRLGQARAYGHRDLKGLEDLGADAWRRILVSNAPRSDLSELRDWDVVRP